MPNKLCRAAPDNEDCPCRLGTRYEHKKPTTIPPIVISSGIMKCSKSMNVAAISPAKKIAYTTASPTDCRPKLTQHPRNTAAVNNSTRKYSAEIRAPQFRHFPPRYTHVSSGTFRYHGIAYLHSGQCDGGDTMLSPSGIRCMHTLRKLPTIEPNTNATTDQK